MSRRRMSKRKDKKVFSHTAVVGKKINVDPKSSRTWIRL